MTQDDMMEVFLEAIMLAFKLAVPVLLIAMIVGGDSDTAGGNAGA